VVTHYLSGATVHTVRYTGSAELRAIRGAHKKAGVSSLKNTTANSQELTIFN